jgi:peptidoglycan hydrolase-like protein with peptidoglycan-binding domain
MTIKKRLLSANKLSALLSSCLLTACSLETWYKPFFIENTKPTNQIAVSAEKPVLVVDRATLVWQAQSLLAELGFDPGPIDSKEGPRTRATVREYQKASGTAVDGEVSESLVVQLLAAKQIQSYVVRRVQARLATLGFDPGPIDGKEGPRTRAAVRAFEETAGLSPSGRITPGLLGLLAAADPPAEKVFLAADAEPAVWRPPESFAENGGGRGPGNGNDEPQNPDPKRVARLPRDEGTTSKLLEDLVSTVEKLERRQEGREAVSADLLERIRALEQEAKARARAETPTSSVLTSTGATAAAQTKVAERQDRAGDSEIPVLTSPSGAGEHDIDDEAVDRALERTLVEAGGLLLPPRTMEVVPQVAYTYQGRNALQIINVGGLPTVARQDVSRDTLESSVTLRLGLPWESQAEVRVPYFINEEQTVTAGTVEEKRDSSGLGDVEVALSKQLLHEGTWIPSTLASLRWKTPTGESNFDPSSDDISIGTGFHGLQGTLTAVKTRDPLAFFGNVSYTTNFSDKKLGNDIDPGDTISGSFGTILAANPDTSLQLAFKLSFTDEAEINGSKAPGSDLVEGALVVGSSFALSRTTLVNISTEIGVTEDAPDFRISASLPIRFSF